MTDRTPAGAAPRTGRGQGHRARDADHGRAHWCRVAEVRRPRAPGHPRRAGHHGQGMPARQARRSSTCTSATVRRSRPSTWPGSPIRCAALRESTDLIVQLSTGGAVTDGFEGQAGGPRCGTRRLLPDLWHGQLWRRGVHQPVALHPRPVRQDQGTRGGARVRASTSATSRRSTGCSATWAPRTAVMSTVTWSWASRAACPADAATLVQAVSALPARRYLVGHRDRPDVAPGHVRGPVGRWPPPGGDGGHGQRSRAAGRSPATPSSSSGPRPWRAGAAPGHAAG